MRVTRKRARMGFDPNGVFVYSLDNLTQPIPRNVKSVRVSGSIHKIPLETFKDCEELEEVILEDGIQTIASLAFAGCCSLTTIKFPSTLRTVLGFAFCNCTGLASIDFSIGMEAIGIGAFENCSALRLLDLSQQKECKMIDKCAFQGCSELAVVRLPPNLKGLILMEVFCDCVTLTHIRFPPGITDISPSAIEGCESLVSIEVPEGLWRLDVVPNITGGSDGIQLCSSLVNLYTPPEQWIVSSVDAISFPRDFKLARIASNWRDLVLKLQDRFKDCLLHKLCYFQSYHPVEETIQTMRDILKTNPRAHEQLDCMGMTPLHILMLAETPVMELVQELPSFVETMLDAEDVFGRTPLDYRCINAMGRRALWKWLPNLLQERLTFPGSDQWKHQVISVAEEQHSSSSSSSNTTTTANIPDNQHSVTSLHIGTALLTLTQLERKEMLSLLEMVLWKIQLQKKKKSDDSDDNNVGVPAGISVNRESCRVQCGSSIVVENVLPFLRNHQE